MEKGSDELMGADVMAHIRQEAAEFDAEQESDAEAFDKFRESADDLEHSRVAD